MEKINKIVNRCRSDWRYFGLIQGSWPLSLQDLAWSLRDPPRSRWDLARSLWDRAWSSWDLFKIPPYLVEIRQDLFKIRSNLAKTSKFRQNPADFCKIWRQFAHSKTNWDPTRNWWHPATRTVAFSGLAAGLDLRDPKWSGRFLFGHKLDPNRPVDRPSIYDMPLQYKTFLYIIWYVSYVMHCVLYNTDNYKTLH